MDGILILEKPKDCTSHDVVYKVRKILNEKVGHTGTLDPLAEGVLPLLVGKGTKISKYLIEHDKIYEAEIQLGIETETLDKEGKIINSKEVDLHNLTDEKVQNALAKFNGKINQIPPIYSAIKINGKKLYEYAREGKAVDIPARTIEIYKIELININREEKRIKFRVHCSKGTYIRVLCVDIAKELGELRNHE